MALRDAAPGGFRKYSAVRAANTREHFESAHASFSRSAASAAGRGGYRRGATVERQLADMGETAQAHAPMRPIAAPMSNWVVEYTRSSGLAGRQYTRLAR
jgi:hypothetical protein